MEPMLLLRRTTVAAPHRRTAIAGIQTAGPGLGEALERWFGENLFPTLQFSGLIDFDPRRMSNRLVNSEFSTEETAV